MRIEERKMYRPNGLIDDFVVYGQPEEYLLFADLVNKAVETKQKISMLSESEITIEIYCLDYQEDVLFTSLQNKTNEYPRVEDWEKRDKLKLMGNETVLSELLSFFKDLSSRGIGYSYLCEYSEKFGYDTDSPEWRLHVE